MESSFYLPIFLIAGGIIFLIIFFHYVPYPLVVGKSIGSQHLTDTTISNAYT